MCVCDILYERKKKEIEEDVEEELYESEENNQNNFFEDNLEDDEEYVLTNTDFKIVAQKIRTIVKKFRKSPLKLDALEKELERTGKKKLKLIVEVKTRWNSLYNMCQRYYVLSDSITATLTGLGETVLDLSDFENSVCLEVIDLLKPLKIFVECLSCTETTMYQALLGFKSLLKCFENSSSSLTPIFYERLSIRYKERENNSMLKMVIYLFDYSKFEQMFSGGNFYQILNETREDIEKFYMKFAPKEDVEETTGISQTNTLELFETKTFEDELYDLKKPKVLGVKLGQPK